MVYCSSEIFYCVNSWKNDETFRNSTLDINLIPLYSGGHCVKSSWDKTVLLRFFFILSRRAQTQNRSLKSNHEVVKQNNKAGASWDLKRVCGITFWLEKIVKLLRKHTDSSLYPPLCGIFASFTSLPTSTTLVVNRLHWLNFCSNNSVYNHSPFPTMSLSFVHFLKALKDDWKYFGKIYFGKKIK